MMETAEGQELLSEKRFSFPNKCWASELPSPQEVKDSEQWKVSDIADTSEKFKIKRVTYEIFDSADKLLQFDGLRTFTTGRQIAYPDRQNQKCTVGTFSKPLQDQAYRSCLQYIQNIGLGFSTNTAEQQTKVDADLIDEVEAWRTDNL
jgi:hypothetical protein